MDKLEEYYIDINRKITEKMETMKEALIPSQFTEIKDVLATHYK
jgi:hypothetical protein